MKGEEILNFVIKMLSDTIFELEQIKKMGKKDTYTIEIKDSKGKVIKTITI